MGRRVRGVGDWGLLEPPAWDRWRSWGGANHWLLGVSCFLWAGCGLDVAGLTTQKNIVEDAGRIVAGDEFKGNDAGVAFDGAPGADATADGAPMDAETLADASGDGGFVDGALADGSVDASLGLAVSTVTATSSLIGAIQVTLTLQGSGFKSGAVVTFQNTTYPAQLQGGSLSIGPLDLPSQAGTYPVMVINADATSATGYLTVHNPVPTVNSLSASSVALGATDVFVTVQGSGFLPGAKVVFGANVCIGDCQVVAVTGGIKFGPVVLPTTGQEVLVTVANPSPTLGSASSTLAVPWPALSVTSAELKGDAVLATGAVLTVRGTNFVEGVKLTLPSGFGPSGQVLPTTTTPTQLTLANVSLPATPGLYEVVVTNPAPAAGSPGKATVSAIGNKTSCSVNATLAGVTSCGAAGTASCCESPLVPGGDFSRNYDGTASFPDASNVASLSAYRLDKFEVSAGRFRRFVEGWVAGWRPDQGAGKHKHLNGGLGLRVSASAFEAGWNTGWNGQLASTKAAWDSAFSNAGMAAWTSGDARPINSVTWFEAYAFCIWDGGFLPTDAEWNYAASGGQEYRVFPWTPDKTATPTPKDASYGCLWDGYSQCWMTDFAFGESNRTPSRWGHYDLAGNMMEWNLDAWGDLTVPCNDCVREEGAYRTHRGGNFYYGTDNLKAARSEATSPGWRANIYGFRCARSP